MKHTINEWEKIVGITIVDPDGFDRSNPNLYNELFTKEEFDDALMRCTVIVRLTNA
jgi:hypothetical protein